MATIKKAIADLTGSDEDKSKAQAQLEFLRSSATAQLELIANKIEKKLTGQDDLNGLYIVPEAIVGTAQGYNVQSSEKPDEAITAAVNYFFSGSKDSVKNGFAKIVETALDTLLGNTEIGETKKEYYFLMMENNSFVRVDLGVWKYYFSQKGIISDTQQAVCYSLYKSVIDHTKVSKDLMINLISQYLGDDLSVIKEYIGEIHELYDILDGTDPKTLKNNFPPSGLKKL